MAAPGAMLPDSEKTAAVFLHGRSLLGDQSVLKKTLTIPDEAQWTRPEVKHTGFFDQAGREGSGVGR